MSGNKQNTTNKADAGQTEATVCSLLVAGAHDPYGQAVCRAFAGPGARIAMQYAVEEEGVWETAAWVASRGGIALPLCVHVEEETPGGTEDAARRLLERVVDDFGRLDVVVVTGNSLESGADGDVVLAEGPEEWIVSLARFSRPFLGKSRPHGHFVVLRTAGTDMSALMETIEEIAEDWEASRCRARIAMEPSRDMDAPGTLLSPEVTAQLVLRRVSQ